MHSSRVFLSGAPSAYFFAQRVCRHQLMLATNLLDVPIANTIDDLHEHDDITANFVLAVCKHVIWLCRDQRDQSKII